MAASKSSAGVRWIPRSVVGSQDIVHARSTLFCHSGGKTPSHSPSPRCRAGLACFRSTRRPWRPKRLGHGTDQGRQERKREGRGGLQLILLAPSLPAFPLPLPLRLYPSPSPIPSKRNEGKKREGGKEGRSGGGGKKCFPDNAAAVMLSHTKDGRTESDMFKCLAIK